MYRQDLYRAAEKRTGAADKHVTRQSYATRNLKSRKQETSFVCIQKHLHIDKRIKVKQTLYRPGQFLRVPGR
jgi:hypothetical protein